MITENVQIELVKAIPQDLMAIGIMVGALFSFLAHRQSKKTEINTNHMKDELVAEVRRASFLAGQKAEKDLAMSRDADYQAGKQAERDGQ